MKRLLPTLLTLGLFSLGCTLTDVKDESCAAEDMFEAENGDRYCRDAAAPAECDHVVDEILDAFVLCADGAITEEELRDELDAQGVSFECESAVATSTDLDACYEQLQDPECEDGLAVISAECEGSVLAEET